MKGHPTLIAFLLLAVGSALAQIPAATSGGQSAVSSSPGNAPKNSNDSAAPSVTGDQNDRTLQSHIENALATNPRSATATFW